MTSKKDLASIITGLEVQIDALYQALGENPPDATIRATAERFCRLNDDQQAKFFNEVASIMKRWPDSGLMNQVFFIGRHLKKCECSTEDARDFVRQLHAAMTGD